MAVLHMIIGRVSLVQQMRITRLQLMFTVCLSSHVFSQCLPGEQDENVFYKSQKVYVSKY